MDLYLAATIAELAASSNSGPLVPMYVRKADADTLIVADGTSCRHQIHDGAQRDALHVARVLAMSVGAERAARSSSPLPFAGEGAARA